MSPRSHPENDPMPEDLPEKVNRSLDEEWEHQQDRRNQEEDDV